MNPILSIIIPVYNSGYFLIEAVSSIENSGFTIPYEVIIVNDGSKNSETLDIINSYRDKYFVLDQENKGASSARNLGISHAKGKYILPFDADDIMIQNNFDTLLKNGLADESIDIIYGDLELFGDINLYSKSKDFNIVKVILNDYILPPASIFKKEVWTALEGYDESLLNSEDWDYWMRAGLAGFKFKHFNICVYKYRKIFNGVSLSQSKAHLFENNQIYRKNKVPGSFFSQEVLSEYFLYSMKNKKLFFKLLLRLFFPRLFNYLKNKKYIPNDIIVD